MDRNLINLRRMARRTKRREREIVKRGNVPEEADVITPPVTTVPEEVKAQNLSSTMFSNSFNFYQKESEFLCDVLGTETSKRLKD